MTVNLKRRDQRRLIKAVSKKTALGRILFTKIYGGREFMYHATKGWRARKK